MEQKVSGHVSSIGMAVYAFWVTELQAPTPTALDFDEHGET
jgi:hypothetical protein